MTDRLIRIQTKQGEIEAVEKTERRTPNSKLIELGRNKFRRSISLGVPMHYVDAEGNLADIDLSARMDRSQFLIDKAPYALRVDPATPSYRYTSATKGAVAVELIDPVASKPAEQIDGAFVWADVAQDTEYKIIPRKFGVAALTVLKSANAPRQWSWRVEGEAGLLKPVNGRDARGQICEIEQETKDGVLTARWTGRVASQVILRNDRAWSNEAVYPITIDPTVNEAIVAGGDDVGSYGAAGFLTNGNSVGAGFYTGLGNLWAGLRFQTVAIPNAATIDAATLSVVVVSRVGSPSSRIYADDVDDAAAWSTGSRIKNITKTTAFAAFAPASTGTKNIDVATIVQEVVDRVGWTSNNDMRFGLFDQIGSGINFLGVAALEHGSAAEAQLDIDYTEGGAAGQPYIKRAGGIPGMRVVGGGVW